MSGGKLLTPQEQIQHLKKKGIIFQTYSEYDAKHFLQEHNYLTKLTAYRKNYSKRPTGELAGQYVHLDFGYLVELSTIDMHLRYLIMDLCLDIEHALKISLLNDASFNPNEDGYYAVAHFLKNNPDFIDSTDRKMNESYCKELYFHNKDHMPMWVLFEVLSFGDLIKFYKLYYELHPNQKPPIDKRFLENVRNIRNASAHSNCLIADLNYKVSPHNSLSNYMTKYEWLSRDVRKKYLRKRFAQDFTAFLVAHKVLVKSEGAHNAARKKLRHLFCKRMLRNRKYFKNNDVISGTYKYCLLLVRKLFP